MKESIFKRGLKTIFPTFFLALLILIFISDSRPYPIRYISMQGKVPLSKEGKVLNGQMLDKSFVDFIIPHIAGDEKFIVVKVPPTDEEELAKELNSTLTEEEESYLKEIFDTEYLLQEYRVLLEDSEFQSKLVEKDYKKDRKKQNYIFYNKERNLLIFKEKIEKKS